MNRPIRLLREHPTVVSYWLMIAGMSAALATFLAIKGFALIAILAAAIAAYAVLFVIAIARYGKGSLRTIAMVIRLARPSR